MAQLSHVLLASVPGEKKKRLSATWRGKGIQPLLASEQPLDLNVMLTGNESNILLVKHAPTKHLTEAMSHGLQDLIHSETITLPK